MNEKMKVAEAEVPANGSSSRKKSKRVMLIDDNEIDNFVNKKLLMKSEFAGEIFEKTTAQAALEYLRTNFNSPEKLPDVIFLDIMMPIMDGFEFLDEYAKLPDGVKSRIKIIMLSSTESFKDLNRANSNRYVFKFLNKPLTEPVIAAIQ